MFFERDLKLFSAAPGVEWNSLNMQRTHSLCSSLFQMWIVFDCFEVIVKIMSQLVDFLKSNFSSSLFLYVCKKASELFQSNGTI